MRKFELKFVQISGKFLEINVAKILRKYLRDFRSILNEIRKKVDINVESNFRNRKKF